MTGETDKSPIEQLVLCVCAVCCGCTTQRNPIPSTPSHAHAHTVFLVPPSSKPARNGFLLKQRRPAGHDAVVVGSPPKTQQISNVAYFISTRAQQPLTTLPFFAASDHSAPERRWARRCNLLFFDQSSPQLATRPASHPSPPPNLQHLAALAQAPLDAQERGDAGTGRGDGRRALVLVCICIRSAANRRENRGDHTLPESSQACRHHLFRTRAPANGVFFINGLIVSCASRHFGHLDPGRAAALNEAIISSPLLPLALESHPPRAQGRSLQEANPAIRPVLVLSCAGVPSPPSGGLRAREPEPRKSQSQSAGAPMGSLHPKPAR